MSNNRQNLLNKIRALMSKTVSAGCTEAEAMSALTMAQAMMDAYEVTADDLKLEGETATIATSDMRDAHNIRVKLATSISRFVGCKVWSSGKQIKFCGLQSDSEFGIWLMETLTEFIRAELKKHIWGNGLTALPNAEKRVHINGFVIGCCNRINARLNELCTEAKASINKNALVVVKNELIARKMNELNIHLSPPRSRSSRINGDSYAAGKAAGDRASFGRPVGGAAGMLRLK